VNNFIKVILDNSNIKEAKIYKAATKAAETPSIGITINNPAAAHVIKDCANITINCLPVFVFSHYKDPFAELARKFTKKDIVEFVGESKKELSLNLLLTLILAKAEKIMPEIFAQTETFDTTVEPILDDPYGSYYAENSYTKTKINTTEEILQLAFNCQD
jgi:hypothetical protein